MKTMHSLLLCCLALLSTVANTSCDEKESTTNPEDKQQIGSGETDGYKLVWQDLFDDAELDSSVWNCEVNGNGNGNAELEYYRAENVAISKEPISGESCLTLTARREDFGGRQFTSGRVNTRGNKSFRHGKVEASIFPPKTANGLWPAFWMMGESYSTVGWPRCSEIDIFETGNSAGINNSTQESYFNGACHWGFFKDGNYPNYAKSSVAPYSLQNGFHLYTLVWDEQYIRMYLDLDKYPDAKPYYEMAISATDDDWAAGNYFHQDCFILFNLAIGGYFTGILNSTAITALPKAGDEAKMYVNFVKVYQK